MTRLESRSRGTAPETAAPATALRITDFRLDVLESDDVPSARQRWKALVAALPAAVAPRWRAYLETPRARLYERQAGQGGFAHGMGAMLVLPARTLTAFADCGASVFAGANVTVLGVSLPTARSERSSGLPALFAYEPDRLETSWRPPRDRHAQAMSLPLLLPGWRAVPPGGFHAGWPALAAEATTQVSPLAGWMSDVARAERTALIAALRRLPSTPGRAGAALGAAEWRALDATLEAAEAALARKVVDGLIRHLHPVVAVGCLSQRGCLRPAEYNWVAGGVTARAWQWRMQALAEFPALCTSAVLPGLPIEVPAHLARRSEALRRLRRWAEDDPVRGAYTLTAVVDEGRPLIRNLARAFRVSPSAVRTLRGVGGEQAQVLEAPPLGWPDLLQTLDALAPEHRPRSMEDWRHFEWLYTQGLFAWRVVHREDIGHGQVFRTRVLRPWLALAARGWARAAMRWRDGFRDVEGLQAAAAFSADLKRLWRSRRVSAARREVLVHHLSHAALPIWQALVNAYAAWQPPPPPLVLRLPVLRADGPQLWAGHVRHQMQRYLGRHAFSAGPWYELPDLNTLEGLPQIRALNSAPALQHEGTTMQHCIATYSADLCLRPRVAFAIGEDRTPDRSTVMLDYIRASGGGWHFTIVQHHAFRNRPTSLACRMAVAHLIDELGGERLRSHIDALEQARVQRQEAIKRAMAAQDDSPATPTVRLPRPEQPAGPDPELLAASRAWHALAAVGWVRGDLFGPGPRSVIGEPGGAAG